MVQRANWPKMSFWPNPSFLFWPCQMATQPIWPILPMLAPTLFAKTETLDPSGGNTVQKTRLNRERPPNYAQIWHCFMWARDTCPAQNCKQTAVM